MSEKIFDDVTMKVIDGWILCLINNSDLPGAQLCIRKKGKVLLNKAYGYANAKTGKRFTVKHMCHIASQSKMFTGCALFMLRDKGAISFDDKITKFIPQFLKHKDKRVKSITIRDMLSHRAGFVRDGLCSGYWEMAIPFPSKEELIKEMMNADLAYEANSVSKYSNSGFGLLGVVIEKAAGVEYGKFVEREIIRPLGKISVCADYPADSARNFADGHSKPLFNGKRMPLKHLPANGLAAATGFCSNAESVNLFAHELLLGDKLVSKEAQKELKFTNWPMLNSKGERYGLGVMINEFDGISLVGHSGGYQGFSSQSRNISGTDYVISFMLNTSEPTTGFVRNMAALIKKIREFFNEDELRNISVSEPMFGLWGANMFLVGKKRALQIAFDSAPADSVVEFEKTKRGFVSYKDNGFNFPGQILSFDIGANGKIEKVDRAGMPLYREKEFKKRAKSFLI